MEELQQNSFNDNHWQTKQCRSDFSQHVTREAIYTRSCHSFSPATPDVCGQVRRSSGLLTDTTDTGMQSSVMPRYTPCTIAVSHRLQAARQHSQHNCVRQSASDRRPTRQRTSQL